MRGDKGKGLEVREQKAGAAEAEGICLLGAWFMGLPFAEASLFSKFLVSKESVSLLDKYVLTAFLASRVLNFGAQKWYV